jgi:FkbM family methyltransferase
MSFVELIEFHSFVPSALGVNPVVLDLGANRGRFSGKMRERFGARCIAVEANPRLMDDLRATVPDAFNIAIFDHVGEIKLELSQNELAATIKSEAGTTQDPEVEGHVTVPCMDLESFAAHAKVDQIDLLKIDIEGAEIDMFRVCSDDFLRKIPQISVEFHDFCGLTPAREVHECLDHLDSLGFASIRFSRIGHQDVLLINRNLFPISEFRLIWTRYGYRNLKGLNRMIRKQMLGKSWSKDYS